MNFSLSQKDGAHERIPLRPPLASHETLRPFASGAAWADIAAEEGFSRKRLRQIIRAATAPGRRHDGPDHKRMQIARLTPALRLAADGSLRATKNTSSYCYKLSPGSTAIAARARISTRSWC
jgi:hypothetical protein